MLGILEITFYLSAAISLTSLSYQIYKTRSFGENPLHTPPQGSSRGGIRYAFTTGMLPWEKESAGNHLPTYLTGVIFHMGIFSAFTYLLLAIWGITLPAVILSLVRILVGLALIGGVGLLAKRLIKPSMRFISCADDFISNILVGAFLLMSLLQTFISDLFPYLLLTSILLFLYVPVGKIRHCFYFFYARFLFGRYFGHRGVFPHRSPD
jgi:hypothetical protein